MKISALQCPGCKDIIYSRARHDFRKCSCNLIFVDGGFDYMRCGWDTTVLPTPIFIEIEVDSTKELLYDDWNKAIDKYGRVND